VRINASSSRYCYSISHPKYGSATWCDRGFHFYFSLLSWVYFRMVGELRFLPLRQGMYCADARLKEVILMCGRFAAVQVVFVSTTPGISDDGARTSR
jgi:hypothetical protein